MITHVPWPDPLWPDWAGQLRLSHDGQLFHEVLDDWGEVEGWRYLGLIDQDPTIPPGQEAAAAELLDRLQSADTRTDLHHEWSAGYYASRGVIRPG